MTRRQIAFSVIASLLLIAFIVPALFHRIDFEQKTKVYVVAVDATRLEKFFQGEKLEATLTDYKNAGATTAVIHEKRGKYDESTIEYAKKAGLNIALSPDMTFADDGNLEELIQKYAVKYIKLQKGIWGKQYESYDKSSPVCDLIDRYDLTLILTENIMQLGNQQPRNYDDYIEAADGKILRAYTTYFTTNIEQKYYPAVYYQMFNSAYDRNTRFITVKQLEDKGYTEQENAQRTQENIRLFCDKMNSLGYRNEGEFNYNDYTPNRPLISAAAAAIAVFMIALILDLLFKKPIPYLLCITLGCAAIAFLATFILPESMLLLYPTAFATIAPCFGVAIFLIYIRKMKQHQGMATLLLSSAGLSLALIAICGGTMAALLSGPEYYLNNLDFRGVKASLTIPLVFAGALLLIWSYKKRSLAEYKELAIHTAKQFRWYHLLIVAAVAIIGYVYIKRSGNVNHISFFETNFRNWLTDTFAARPRTKDFLLAWPCFTLYIYYAKTNKAPLIQWIFGLGSALLFASSINTFCHSFTLAETMFLRVATGLLFGIVCSAAFYGLNLLILKLFSLLNQKTEC